MRATLVVFGWSLWLVGCGGVFCANPASDGDETRVDERLIGFWAFVPGESRDEDGRVPEVDPREANVFALGRDPKVPGAMRLAVTAIHESGEVAQSASAIRATRIADRDYLSLSLEEHGEAAGGGPWLVLRYDVLEDGRLRIRTLDLEVVAASVKAGEVEGKVEDASSQAPDPGPRVVTLSAPTAALRAWLAIGGDALFAAKGVLVFRRLQL